MNPFPENPNRNSTAERIHTVELYAIPIRKIPYKTAVMIKMVRLPKRLIAQPATGNTTSDPRGSINNTLPNWASLRLKSDFIVGIRAAHEENVVPLRKKNAPTASRYRYLGYALAVVNSTSIKIKSPQYILRAKLIC